MLPSIGDSALPGLLRNATARAKSDLLLHTQEMTTGITSTPARHLKGDLGAISAIDRRLALLEGHGAVTRAAGLQFEAMQAGLDRLADSADTLGAQLRIALQSNLPDALSATGGLARAAFDEAVSALNTQVAGRSLFAGTAPEGPALRPAAEILEALQTALAAAAPAGAPADIPALVQQVKDWFADPAGFAQAAYLGGAAGADLRLSPELSAPAPETALAPEVTAHLAALALGALLQDAPQAVGPQARAALAEASATALLGTQSGLTALQARTGLSEARVATAEARNNSETASLSVARADLLGVDPYEAASRLEEARGRLEALFTLTARLSRLSLLEYLR